MATRVAWQRRGHAVTIARACQTSALCDGTRREAVPSELWHASHVRSPPLVVSFLLDPFSPSPFPLLAPRQHRRGSAPSVSTVAFPYLGFFPPEPSPPPCCSSGRPHRDARRSPELSPPSTRTAIRSALGHPYLLCLGWAIYSQPEPSPSSISLLLPPDPSLAARQSPGAPPLSPLPAIAASALSQIRGGRALSPRSAPSGISPLRRRPSPSPPLVAGAPCGRTPAVRPSPAQLSVAASRRSSDSPRRPCHPGMDAALRSDLAGGRSSSGDSL